MLSTPATQIDADMGECFLLLFSFSFYETPADLISFKLRNQKREQTKPVCSQVGD
jgi:hypothetical protein